MKIKASYTNKANWKEINVNASIPAKLEKLNELAHNMWWSWNHSARDLFDSIDTAAWLESGKNPVLMLSRLSYEKLEEMANDQLLMSKMDKVFDEFKAYMNEKPDEKRPSVAYLCMEYGLNQVLKIYSGGLGVLAGDYLKEASDSNVRMCAVGFLYRFGYFTQTLSMDGQQIANYEAQDFNSLPIERVVNPDGTPLVIDVPYINYQVRAYVWRVNVGRIPLYLLDTDNDMNSEFDRSITHSLYGGDWENRLKQEILLG
ncbi:MAG: alpha-glucan family phosphorylase, partial [Bacteroidaceae bacterium]|nr:alpha-glucan family phosphorylase [Bacteroidaceae bacterium]